MTHRVTLLTGGNEGDVGVALGAARGMAEQRVGRVVFASSVRRSAPWGVFDVPQQDFLNQVLVVETALTPLEVLDATQGIERALGRVSASDGLYAALGIGLLNPHVRTAHCGSKASPALPKGSSSQKRASTDRQLLAVNHRVYSARPIDIDILYYDDVEVDMPRLTIPHPRIGEREFVRVLLEELPPELRATRKPL